MRAPSTRALEPGTRPAAHSSRRGPQGSERSAPQAASPALQVPRGALDTWRPKAKISGGGRPIPGSWQARVSPWASRGPPHLTLPGLKARLASVPLVSGQLGSDLISVLEDPLAREREIYKPQMSSPRSVTAV